MFYRSLLLVNYDRHVNLKCWQEQAPLKIWTILREILNSVYCKQNNTIYQRQHAF